jgi:hypothetical protein
MSSGDTLHVVVDRREARRERKIEFEKSVKPKYTSHSDVGEQARRR